VASEASRVEKGPAMKRAVKISGRMTGKDWITTGVAVLAFVVSVSTTYYTVFRTTDDISVLIMPFWSLYAEDEKFDIFSQTGLSFVNAGKRTVAITNIMVTITQPNNKELLNTDCFNGYKQHTFLSTVPFAVRPGEIVTKIYKMSEFAPADQNIIYMNPPYITLTDTNKVASDPSLAICISFRVLSADGTTHVTNIPVFRKSSKCMT
jgi:hypothetical protein